MTSDGPPSGKARSGFEAPFKAASRAVRTVVDGVEMVTIPATLYKELLARTAAASPGAALRAELRQTLRRRGRQPLPSTIERDPDVAAFLRARFALADTLEMAHAACLARFGPDRTPSVSRIARLRAKDRGAG